MIAAIFGVISSLAPVISWIMKLVGFRDEQVKDFLKRISDFQNKNPGLDPASEEALALAKIEADKKKEVISDGKKDG